MAALRALVFGGPAAGGAIDSADSGDSDDDYGDDDGGGGFFNVDARYDAQVAADPLGGPGARVARNTARRRAPGGRATAARGLGRARDSDDSDDEAASALDGEPNARSSAASRLETLGEARAHVRALIDAQLERAQEMRPPLNVVIHGDGAARGTLLLLLPEPMMRDVFLQVARAREAWPRLRPLFGAPPYHFLLPQDGGTLRAGGFARDRERMTYEEAGRIANVAQFAAQFVDAYTREYRVVVRDPHDADRVPGVRQVRELRENALRMQVKIRKRNRALKRQLARGDTKRQLFFPRVGEVIELRESRLLQRVLGLRAPGAVEVRVLGVRPRGRGAHTAELFVRVE